MDTDAAKKIQGEIEEMIKAYPEYTQVIHLDSKDRYAKCTKAQQYINTIKAKINPYRRAINCIENETTKKVHKQYLENFNKFCNDSTKELKELRKADFTKSNNVMDEIDMDQPLTAQQVMNSAVKAQDQNLDILRDIERDAHTTLAIGNEVANKLESDNEKIGEIDKSLNTLNSNLTLAKGEVEWFSRQFATDKCFIMLLVLLVLGVAGLVFYLIYKSKHK